MTSTAEPILDVASEAPVKSKETKSSPAIERGPFVQYPNCIIRQENVCEALYRPNQTLDGHRLYESKTLLIPFPALDPSDKNKLAWGFSVAVDTSLAAKTHSFTRIKSMQLKLVFSLPASESGNSLIPSLIDSYPDATVIANTHNPIVIVRSTGALMKSAFQSQIGYLPSGARMAEEDGYRRIETCFNVIRGSKGSEGKGTDWIFKEGSDSQQYSPTNAKMFLLEGKFKDRQELDVVIMESKHILGGVPNTFSFSVLLDLPPMEASDNRTIQCHSELYVSLVEGQTQRMADRIIKSVDGFWRQGMGSPNWGASLTSAKNAYTGSRK